jgi:capsular exopolysaccharide synthesis family protein
MIILMCFSAMLTSALLTYILSEKYQSSIQVLIRPQKSINFVSKREELLNFPVSYVTPIETTSKTYSEIIKSRVVAERVYRELGLDSMAEEEAGWWKKTKTRIKEFILKTWIILKYGRIEESDPFSSAVADIQGGLSVKPTKETFLFEIEAEARSPQMASAIANASAKIFLNYLQELSLLELGDAMKLSIEKLEISRKQLDQSRDVLTEFKETHGVTSIRKEIALELESLSALQDSFNSVSSEIKGAVAQKEEIRRQLSKAVNPVYQSLLSELSQVETHLEGLRAKNEHSATAIQNKERLIDQMPKNEASLAKLELSVKLNESTHVLLSREYEELKIAAASEVPIATTIHKALSPQYPVRPIKIYHVILAGILALLTGLGLALLAEHMNVTIRSIDDAERDLGLPVLMTIPRLGIDRRRDRRAVWPLMISSAKEPVQEQDEKRKCERADVQLPIQIYRDGDPMTENGITTDLSAGGVCCYMEGKLNLQPQDKVAISLDLKPSSPEENKTCEGVVLRSKEMSPEGTLCTTAMEFVNIEQSLEKDIKNTLQNRNHEMSSPLPSRFEEPIRGLRSELHFLSKENLSSFLITSSSPKEGKSTLVASLAMSLVTMGKKVVLVDADLRRPSQHKIFGLPNETGLSNILTEETPRCLKWTKSGLCVLTSGPSAKDPSALLVSGRMAQLLTSLQRDFDFVLIDSPSVLGGSEAALLASFSDGTILVVNTGTTEVEDGRRTKQILERAQANLLGIVMNNHDQYRESYYTWS